MQYGIDIGNTFKNSKSRDRQSKAVLITGSYAILDVGIKRFVITHIESEGEDKVILRIAV